MDNEESRSPFLPLVAAVHFAHLNSSLFDTPYNRRTWANLTDGGGGGCGEDSQTKTKGF